jgi:hypothetical protein
VDDGFSGTGGTEVRCDGDVRHTRQLLHDVSGDGPLATDDRY